MTPDQLAHLTAQTWNTAYPDRRPWHDLETDAQQEWLRVFALFHGLTTASNPAP